MRASTLETALAERPSIGGGIIVISVYLRNAPAMSCAHRQIGAEDSRCMLPSYVPQPSLAHQATEVVDTEARGGGALAKRERLLVFRADGTLELRG
jgi:hypothetical protein